MYEIYERIAKSMDGMSKTQKKLAKYILQDRAGVSFLNISKLARLSGVSEASIVRFAAYLGFDGYPALKTALQESAQEQLSIKERLTISYSAYGERESIVADVFRDDINSITQTLENIDMNTFFQVAEKIMKARRIYICAGRSAIALGHFLHYYLDMILGNTVTVYFPTNQADCLMDIGPDDLMIGITFSRYTQDTVRVMEYACNKGCVTAAITDTLFSPIVAYATHSLFVETKMPSVLDSYVAPLSLINALIAYISRCKNKELEQRIQQLEEVWSQFDVFR